MNSLSGSNTLPPSGGGVYLNDGSGGFLPLGDLLGDSPPDWVGDDGQDHGSNGSFEDNNTGAQLAIQGGGADATVGVGADPVSLDSNNDSGDHLTSDLNGDSDGNTPSAGAILDNPDPAPLYDGTSGFTPLDQSLLFALGGHPPPAGDTGLLAF